MQVVLQLTRAGPSCSELLNRRAAETVGLEALLLLLLLLRRVEGGCGTGCGAACRCSVCAGSGGAEVECCSGCERGCDVVEFWAVPAEDPASLRVCRCSTVSEVWPQVFVS
jgi:hypothetical protein